MNKKCDLIKDISEVLQESWKNNIYPLFAQKILVEGTFTLDEEKINSILDKHLGEGAHKHIEVLYYVSKYKYIENKVIYKYKHSEVQPVSFFIRPKDCLDITMTDILKECIKQDTYMPNIKHLQTMHKDVIISPTEETAYGIEDRYNIVSKNNNEILHHRCDPNVVKQICTEFEYKIVGGLKYI